jgi:hypothetical protein
MKSLYIIALLALSVNIYAQQDKKATETQDAPNYTESKEFEAKMMKEAQERSAQKTAVTTLASEQGLEVKKQQPPKQTANSNSGKLLTSNATTEEFLASIPGRKSQKPAVSNAPSNNTKGLLPSPNLTLEDIKKTIPKN